jgi:hypothetical protein
MGKTINQLLNRDGFFVNDLIYFVNDYLSITQSVLLIASQANLQLVGQTNLHLCANNMALFIGKFLHDQIK